MLRRPPSQLQLTQDDVDELIEQLDESSIEIMDKRDHLRTSTRLPEFNQKEDDMVDDPGPIDSSFQKSPLDHRRERVSAPANDDFVHERSNLNQNTNQMNEVEQTEQLENTQVVVTQANNTNPFYTYEN